MTPTANEAELLAAIHASPSDDGVRAVYADVLTERGDLHGELITLQLTRATGRGTPAMLRRETALLREHGETWVGLLAAVPAEGRVFERGFLDSVMVVGVHARAAGVALFAEPAWATVRAISMQQLTEEMLRLMLAAPRLSNLRELQGLVGTAMPWLAAEVRGERAAKLDAVSFYGTNVPADRAVVSEAPGLPGVRRLGLDGRPSGVQWMVGTPLWRRITTLQVPHIDNGLGFWCKRIREQPGLLETLVVEDRMPIRYGVDLRGLWRFELSRGSDGDLSRLHASFRAVGPSCRTIGPDLANALTSLDARALTEIVISSSRAFGQITANEHAAIERAMGRFTRLSRVEVPTAFRGPTRLPSD